MDTNNDEAPFSYSDDRENTQVYQDMEYGGQSINLSMES